MTSSGDAIPGASPRRPSAASDLSDQRHPVEHPVDIDAMVVVHLGLADALARQYAGRGVDSEDLAQVARLALVRAAHRFDPLRGASFSTDATPCILRELRRYSVTSAGSCGLTTTSSPGTTVSGWPRR